MLIYLLRHGLTQENLEKRYQGRRDVPLCPQGLAQLRRADFAPKTVMITSLQRTRQTAEVLFPDAELVVADGLKEMDFGVFAITGRWSTTPSTAPGWKPAAKAAARAGKARRNSASVSAQHLPRWWMPLWRRGNRSW